MQISMILVFPVCGSQNLINLHIYIYTHMLGGLGGNPKKHSDVPL